MLPNQSHLQIELTPEAYHAILPPNQSPLQSLGQLLRLPEHPYWLKLPNYLIARCPFCGEEYQERLDTYTLHYWGTTMSGISVFVGDENRLSRCAHFVSVQKFIHLNQTDPHEVSKQWECDEVPNVMLPFLPNELESYAVMHALPICRIEEERFVPRYTLYMITYYSAVENVGLLIDRGRQQCGWGEVCRPPNSPTVDQLWWDLNYWVRAGRLHWLTPDHPQLPLQKGPPEAFPYGNIYVPPKAFYPNTKGPGKKYSHRDKFSYSYAQNE